MSCSNLGQTLVLQEDATGLPQAAASLKEALDVFHEIGDARGLSECLMSCAALAARTSRPDEGARLVGAATALRKERDISLTAGDAMVDRTLLAIVQEAAEDRYATQAKAGARLSMEEMVGMAISCRPIPAPYARGARGGDSCGERRGPRARTGT